jgi:hypothetical protein
MGVPVLIFLPVPLILPVCNGFDRIDFEENEAMCLHTRRIVYSGFYFSPGGGSMSDPVSRFPLQGLKPNTPVEQSR